MTQSSAQLGGMPSAGTAFVVFDHVQKSYDGETLVVKDLNLSLRYIIPELEKILNHKVLFAEDSMGPATQAISKNLKSGEILLLENLRFYPEETNGDEDFAKQLSSYADCYINDAFGTAHRAHASTTVIAKFFNNKMEEFSIHCGVSEDLLNEFKDK